MDTLNTQQPGPSEPLSKKQQRRLEKQQAKQERHAGQATKRTGGRIVFWLVILVVLGFFVYAIAKLATSTPGTNGAPTNIVITADDHVLGNPKANVQLIEYADFQCPACGAFYPIVKQLVNDYGDRMYYAYRHFPLPQHQFGKPMAYAAEAASNQGKFFEMHDLIYKNQNQWSLLSSVEQTISGFASQLKLNVSQFQADANLKVTQDVVESDYQGGVGYGVNSTPSFFINGVKINNPRNIDEFKVLIDQALLTAHAPTPNTSSTAN